MRLKASPLRSGVLSPVTTAPAHREPPEARGDGFGKIPLLALVLTFLGGFPDRHKNTAETDVYGGGGGGLCCY